MTLYCPKCGYNLTALTENRCPECGEGFDPKSLAELQQAGISTRSVILQLIFVPVGIAVLSTLVFCGTAMAGSDSLTIAASFLAFFGFALLHTLPMACAFVRTQRLRDGEYNDNYIFHNVWFCCILFTIIEVVLAFGYAYVGSVGFLISMMPP
jgi:hypothetical protein